MIRALAALALVLLAAPAAAQPWCADGGLNPTERTICYDVILRERDAQMADAYRDVHGPGEPTAEQRDWLALRRDACATNVLCIERAYDERIAELRAAAVPAAAPLPAPAPDRRPWCGASRLNRTERAICADDTLANLDAAMEAIYGAMRADDADAAQIEWLRGQRDACGGEVDCIAAAYLRRIAELGARLRGA